MLTHKGTQPLHTPRLLLRRFTSADACAMFDNWASDPEVTAYLTWSPHSSPEDTKALLTAWEKEYAKENYYHWAIVLEENGDSPIGSIMAMSPDDRTKQVEIGYCIGKRWWHKGIMSESLQAVINFLFDEVGMNRIQAKHDSRNHRSGMVMQKCGMRYEGLSRQAGWNNQGLCDTCTYAILAEDRTRKET